MTPKEPDRRDETELAIGWIRAEDGDVPSKPGDDAPPGGWAVEPPIRTDDGETLPFILGIAVLDVETTGEAETDGESRRLIEEAGDEADRP